MKHTGWAVSLLVLALCQAVPAREPGSDEAARRLATRAAGELRQAGEAAEFNTLLEAGRLLARSDARTAAALVAKAFDRAKAENDSEKRLVELEAVALAAGPIDRELSTAALRLVRADERCKRVGDRIELKVLAIDLVLAHRNGSPEKAGLIEKARQFCEDHETVWQMDKGTFSPSALAEYVSFLEPELGIGLWAERWPGIRWERWAGLTWDARLAVASDLVHFDAARAVPVLRELVGATPDDGRKVKAAVALYKAGATKEATLLLEKLAPPSVGGGWPLGDLICRVAAQDPQAALRLAATLGTDDGLRNAQDLAYRGAAVGRPKEVPELLKDIRESYRRESVFQAAAESLVRMGDLATAREMADRMDRGSGHRAVALARVAEAARDFDLMAEAVRQARHGGRGGRMWKEAAAASIRAFGVRRTIALLEEIAPETKAPAWDNADLYSVLLVVAEEDPRWALEVFKRGPQVPPKRGHTEPTGAVSHLLPKLAYEDPQYVAAYIQSHGEAEHPQSLEALKQECVREIARRSPDDAAAFAKAVGVERHSYDLETEHQIGRIMAAGARVDDVLAGMTFRHPDESTSLVTRAVDRLAGGPNDLLHHTDRILAMARAMKDKALADKALLQAVGHLYAAGEKQEACRLAEVIGSPNRRAEAFLAMARQEFDPRPRALTSLLAGWSVGRKHLPPDPPARPNKKTGPVVPAPGPGGPFRLPPRPRPE